MFSDRFDVLLTQGDKNMLEKCASLDAFAPQHRHDYLRCEFFDTEQCSGGQVSNAFNLVDIEADDAIIIIIIIIIYLFIFIFLFLFIIIIIIIIIATTKIHWKSSGNLTQAEKNKMFSVFCHCSILRTLSLFINIIIIITIITTIIIIITIY